jgi:chromosome segregation ATPase
VTEDHESIRMTALLNKEEKEIQVLLAGSPASPEVTKALQKAKELWSRVTETTRELGRIQEELNVIVNEQTRLRQDLRIVPADSPLHRRYLEKFDKQETQLETLQDQLKKLWEQERKQRKEYEDYVSGLNVG